MINGKLIDCINLLVINNTYMSFSNIQTVLGSESEELLGFSAPKIAKDRLHVPSPDLIDSVFSIVIDHSLVFMRRDFT